MNHGFTGGAVLRGGPAAAVSATGTSSGEPDAAARISGLDAARGLAILGMLAAHTLQGGGDAFYDGRSSILFALLAGISLGLMTGGDQVAPQTNRRRARLSIVIRGLALIVLGFALWALQTNVAIILDTYGFLFLLCLPLLFARRWLLASLTVVCAVIGPLVVAWLIATTEQPGTLPVASHSALSVPLGWLTSYYPAPVWLGYILMGLLLARSGITRTRVLLLMSIGGSVVAILGYGTSFILQDPVVAHSDSTAEFVSSGALGVAIIGLLVASLSRVRSRAGRVLLRPLTAAGSMPLTLYTGQVIVLALLPLPSAGAGSHPGEPLVMFVGLAAGSVIFASLWSLRFRQGPLEWLMARLSLRRPWCRPSA